MPLAELLEQYISLGVFVVAAALCALSVLAWRRERDRRMAVVSSGYAMFAVYGFVVFFEPFLRPSIGYTSAELLEHSSAVLVLGGLLTFFAALTRG
jgi:hypothetical protein